MLGNHLSQQLRSITAGKLIIVFLSSTYLASSKPGGKAHLVFQPVSKKSSTDSSSSTASTGTSVPSPVARLRDSPSDSSLAGSTPYSSKRGSSDEERYVGDTWDDTHSFSNTLTASRMSPTNASGIAKRISQAHTQVPKNTPDWTKYVRAIPELALLHGGSAFRFFLLLLTSR